MKRLMTGLFFVMILSIQMHAQSDTLRFEPDGNAADSVEYELIVLDPGYEMFLATQPHMEFYSQQ